jgi:pimeloyl-ACP methyl ester carboxylesterase
MYSFTAQNLAGMGYEVITMDHTYESNVVRFPDGSKIYGGRITYEWDVEDPDDPLMAWGQEVRVTDASFVLDSIGISPHDKVVAVGHSTGGAAAAALMVNDTRVVAAINLDGTMYGSKYGHLTSGVDRPFFLFASKNHNFTIDKSWEDFWDATVTNHPGTWLKVVRISEAQHNTFGDFAAIGDMLPLRENEFLRDNFIGNVTGERAMKIMREYMSDFIDFGLGCKGEGLLSRPSPEYPDVEFAREAGMAEL